jgi:hypothetical protein
LLVASTLQLLADNALEGGYFRATRRTFAHWFLPPDAASAQDGYPARAVALFTANDTLAALSGALRGYEEIATRAVDAFFYRDASGPRLTLVQYRARDLFNPRQSFDRTLVTTVVHNVTSAWLGPLNASNSAAEVREALLRSVEIRLSFELVAWASLARRSCLVWRVDLLLDFRSRSHISMTLSPTVVSDCDPRLNTLGDIFVLEDLLWLNLVLVVVAVLFAWRIVRNVGERRPSRWSVLNALACVLLLVHACMNLASNTARKPTSGVQVLCSGLGTALLWVTLSDYLSADESRGYRTLILTIDRALPKILRFLLGTAPFFTGFCLFGLCAFGGHSARFGSLRDVAVTLFSLLNGDAIRETFADLLPMNSLLAQVYIYGFVLLFSYVVINLLLVIVEESFFVYSSSAAMTVVVDNDALSPAAARSAPGPDTDWGWGWFPRLISARARLGDAAQMASAPADVERPLLDDGGSSGGG